MSDREKKSLPMILLVPSPLLPPFLTSPPNPSHHQGRRFRLAIQWISLCSFLHLSRYSSNHQFCFSKFFVHFFLILGVVIIGFGWQCSLFIFLLYFFTTCKEYFPSWFPQEQTRS